MLIFLQFLNRFRQNVVNNIMHVNCLQNAHCALTRLKYVILSADHAHARLTLRSLTAHVVYPELGASIRCEAARNADVTCKAQRWTSVTLTVGSVCARISTRARSVTSATPDTSIFLSKFEILSSCVFSTHNRLHYLSV